MLHLGEGQPLVRVLELRAGGSCRSSFDVASCAAAGPSVTAASFAAASFTIVASFAVESCLATSLVAALLELASLIKQEFKD